MAEILHALVLLKPPNTPETKDFEAMEECDEC